MRGNELRTFHFTYQRRIGVTALNIKML